MKYFVAIFSLALLFSFSGLAQASTHAEQRAEIQKMKSGVLAKLYKTEPEAENKIANAVGYAIFSSADVAYIFFSGSYGHGLAHDNRDGHETYMQMASAGIGLGIGVKDYRVIFVFSTADAYHDFIKKGLDLSGHADLAAKQGSNGGAVGGAQEIADGVKVYQLTDTGLMAQAMLKGTKYWLDSDLNE